jgi:hypothetical protein
MKGTLHVGSARRFHKTGEAPGDAGLGAFREALGSIPGPEPEPIPARDALTAQHRQSDSAMGG